MFLARGQFVQGQAAERLEAGNRSDGAVSRSLRAPTRGSYGPHANKRSLNVAAGTKKQSCVGPTTLTTQRAHSMNAAGEKHVIILTRSD